MNRLKNLIIDSATPIAAATTTVFAALLIQKTTNFSLGFTNNITDSAKLIALISTTSILAEKYNIY